jgi:hypothetical protein
MAPRSGFSETLTTVQSVAYDDETGSYSISSGAAHTGETLSDPSRTLAPGTGGISGKGSFSSQDITQDITYVGAVTIGGTVEGYIVKYTTGPHDVHYEYVSTGAALPQNTALNVNCTDMTLCFMAGTMIATPQGEKKVETLQPGDQVTLATGGAAPVSWVGRQTIATRFADPLRTQPIRVRAGALAENMPARDLLLSPDHALLVGGVLAHAGALVNGVSIKREADTPEMFTYYHVELATHELLLAESTPAESFVDNAGRLAFDNWDERQDGPELVEMDLPRARSARQIPATIRARLAARAEALYGTETQDAA